MKSVKAIANVDFNTKAGELHKQGETKSYSAEEVEQYGNFVTVIDEPKKDEEVTVDQETKKKK